MAIGLLYSLIEAFWFTLLFHDVWISLGRQNTYKEPQVFNDNDAVSGVTKIIEWEMDHAL